MTEPHRTILDGRALSLAMLGRVADPRDYLLALYPKLEVPPLDHVVLTAAPLVARVNQGQWIASCSCGARTAIEQGAPAPGCVVFLEGPGALLGWCPRCRNGSTGRGWRPIEIPPSDVVAAIEAVLVLRPNLGDRNWEPGETVDDLLAQNREHGDPVPDPATMALGPVHGPDWRELVAPFTPIAKRVRSRLGRLMGRR